MRFLGRVCTFSYPGIQWLSDVYYAFRKIRTAHKKTPNSKYYWAFFWACYERKIMVGLIMNACSCKWESRVKSMEYSYMRLSLSNNAPTRIAKVVFKLWLSKIRSPTTDTVISNRIVGRQSLKPIGTRLLSLPYSLIIAPTTSATFTAQL